MPLPLTTVFADLPDPRMETANKLHKLVDILVIATCAVIGGADGWEEVAEYGRAKEDFFQRFLELPNGIPSHDTFERVVWHCRCSSGREPKGASEPGG